MCKNLAASLILMISTGAALFVPARARGDSCPDTFAKLPAPPTTAREITSAYWSHELDSLLLRGPGSAPAKAAKAVLAWSKHGIKVSIAPTILAVDVPRAAFRGIRAVRGGAPYKRLLMIPVDIAQRNGAHLAGFTALSATGYTWIQAMEREAYVDDIENALPPVDPLNEDEVAVFVFPQGDHKLARDFYKLVQQRYEGKAKPDQLINLYPYNAEEFLNSLKYVREGRGKKIRDLHFMSHGAPGKMDMSSSGFFDLVKPSKPSSEDAGPIQEIDAASIKRLALLTRNWPSDLFAVDPRFSIYSCSVGFGKKGEQFIQDFGALVLKNGGTVVAPTESLRAIRRSDLEPIFKVSRSLPQSLNPDDLAGFLMIHALLGPIAGFMKGSSSIDKLNPLDWDDHTGPPVKVRKIP